MGQIKHNGRYSDLYDVYYAMRRRCLNTKCKDYKNYGGREGKCYEPKEVK